MRTGTFSLKALLAATLWMSLGFGCIAFAARHTFEVPLTPNFDRFVWLGRLARASTQVGGYVFICAGISQLLKRLRFAVLLFLMVIGTFGGSLIGAVIEHALIPGHHFVQQTYDDRSWEPGPIAIACTLAGTFGVPLLGEILLRFRKKAAPKPFPRRRWS